MRGEIAFIQSLRSGVAVSRGAVAIVFGLFALMWPLMSSTAVLGFLTFYFIVDAMLAVRSIARGFAPARLIEFVRAEAGVGVVAALVALVAALFFAAPSNDFVATTAGSWLALTGALRFFMAAKTERSRREALVSWRWWRSSGALAFIVGLILVLRPSIEPHQLFFVFGAYAVFFGFMQVASGLEAGSAARAEGMSTF